LQAKDVGVQRREGGGERWPALAPSVHDASDVERGYRELGGQKAVVFAVVLLLMG
jgi:hypothetical protein